jgi:hypothetical protein
MENSFDLVDAEKAFKNYKCMHFYMDREEPDVYLKYQALNISKEQEKIWASESYMELTNLLINVNTAPSELWWRHSTSVHLVETHRLLQMLEDLSQISLKILSTVPAGDCIMCAESILGHSDITYKQGVIFLSLQEHGVGLANNFLELADRYVQKHDEGCSTRSKRSLQRAEIIRSMLAA